MQLYGTKTQKFLHCPETKGQRGQAQNLAMGQDGLGKHVKIRNTLGRGTEWNWMRDGMEWDAGQNGTWDRTGRGTEQWDRTITIFFL